MHFAEGAAHEAALLGGNQNPIGGKPTAPDNHAVVELLRQVENLEMRTDLRAVQGR